MLLQRPQWLAMLVVLTWTQRKGCRGLSQSHGWRSESEMEEVVVVRLGTHLPVVAPPVALNAKVRACNTKEPCFLRPFLCHVT